jgi:hypothetical protein
MPYHEISLVLVIWCICPLCMRPRKSLCDSLSYSIAGSFLLDIIFETNIFTWLHMFFLLMDIRSLDPHGEKISTKQ